MIIVFHQCSPPRTKYSNWQTKFQLQIPFFSASVIPVRTVIFIYPWVTNILRWDTTSILRCVFLRVCVSICASKLCVCLSPNCARVHPAIMHNKARWDLGAHLLQLFVLRLQQQVHMLRQEATFLSFLHF